MWIARREHTMKRIATIAAVLAAGAIAVPVASGGNVPAQSKPQVTTQVVDIQVAKVQRARAAVSLQRHVIQRHLVQIAYAKRVSLLRAKVR
jgi:hypothetical protein